MKVFFFFLACILFVSSLFSATKQYYCTAADSKYYNFALNLIGSIHRHNYEHLEKIIVYDLGLTKAQEKNLKKIQKVEVHKVYAINNHILTPLRTCPSGRKVRGLFSWKPVLLKQALDRFPYVLYLDAGLCVMSNLDPLFEYIEENGYFFINSHHNIKERITNYVTSHLIDKKYPSFKETLLDDTTFLMSAGFQGVSRKIKNSYILPVYELAKNIKYFEDDKSAYLGWGSARHDQTLFSILMHVNNYKLFDQGFIKLKYQNNSFKEIFCSTILNPDMTHVWVNQGGLTYKGGNIQYIKYK